MPEARAVSWEAPEHRHTEKDPEWVWIVAILAGSASVAVWILGNLLFSLLIIVAAATFVIAALKEPRILPHSVSVRGIRIGETFFPYPTLDAYYIDEEQYAEPHLLVRSKKLFMPLLVMPIPQEYIDDVEDILAERLKEEELEEPFFHILLEFLGF